MCGVSQKDGFGHAIAHHLELARAHERDKRQALVGRAVSMAEIGRLQAGLDAMKATSESGRDNSEARRSNTRPLFAVAGKTDKTAWRCSR